MTQLEVLEILYGDGAWEVTKALTDKQKRAGTAALSAVGATAGAAGLGYAGTKFGGAARRSYKVASGAGKLRKLGTAVKAGAKEEPFGTALVPLEVAGLGGEVMATKILHGDTKKKAPAGMRVSKRHLTPVSKRQLKDEVDKGMIKNVKNTLKNAETTSANATKASEHAAQAAADASKVTGRIASITPKKAALAGAGGIAGLGAAQFGASYAGARGGTKSGYKAVDRMNNPRPGGRLKSLGMKLRRPKTAQQPQAIGKAVDFDMTVEISKADDDKRQVFGWASIITKDGQPVLDLQDDIMTIDTIEKAAYSYVQKSRKGGNQHQKTEAGPVHVSDLIESFVVTEEKKKVLGLPDEFPTGWFTGFQVHDDATWAAVKDGRLPMLSIHGSGRRTEKELDYA